MALDVNIESMVERASMKGMETKNKLPEQNAIA